MPQRVSRRSFLGQAAAAPAAGVGITMPTQAWIILAVNWEYNDEYTYPEGAHALSKVYFDRGTAEAECRRMCEEFFAGQSPLDFEVDFQYFADKLPDDATEDSTTWDQLRSAGFPDPFHVQEMET